MDEWAVRGHILSTAEGPVSSRLWPVVEASPGAVLPLSCPYPFCMFLVEPCSGRNLVTMRRQGGLTVGL